jgi:hypothetical protein
MFLLAAVMTVLAVAAGCGSAPPNGASQPSLTGLEISGYGMLSGSVSNAGADDRIYVYLTGGESHLQESETENPMFPIKDGGRFEVQLTDTSARSATVYVANKGINFHDLSVLEAGSVAKAERDVPDITFFKIVYDLNYETDETPPQSTLKFAGRPAKLTPDVPKRAEYQFLGWSPNKGDEEPKYSAGGNFVGDYDATLYAVWAYAGETPKPEPFVLLADDGATTDRYRNVALMGSDNNGNDGSIAFDTHDTGEAYIGEGSVRISYTAPADGSAHWSGLVLLYAPEIEDEGAWKGDPGELGPDLSKGYTKITLWVKGSGGVGKIFSEYNGGAQASKFITFTEEWQQVVLEIPKNAKYNNIMFGASFNQANPGEKGGTVSFWADGLQFE